VVETCIGGVYYRGGEEREHISEVQRRRELISVWEDVGASQG
jgi:hypothetical protein